MKRIVSISVLSALLLTACGRNEANMSTDSFDYKTGLAAYTHTNDTYGYSEGKNGQSNVSTTIVAAVFDDKGKIIDIKIDEVESRTNFDDKGQLSGYSSDAVRSKKELGDNYGMKAVSSIGKEWYQQVETLEQWLIGKDVNTVISSAAGKMRGLGDRWEYDEYKNYANDDNYAMRGRTGTNNANSAASGSPSQDMDSIAEDFAEGVGDVVDDIMGNGTADNGTMYNNGTAANTDWMDADLKAGVTIDVSYIQMAIEKAYKNAD